MPISIIYCKTFKIRAGVNHSEAAAKRYITTYHCCTDKSQNMECRYSCVISAKFGMYYKHNVF